MTTSTPRAPRQPGSSTWSINCRHSLLPRAGWRRNLNSTTTTKYHQRYFYTFIIRLLRLSRLVAMHTFFCFAYCESKLKILSEEQAAHNSILPHVFHKDARVGKPFVANLNSVADMMLARSALASLSIPKLLWIIVLSYVVVKLRREWRWGRGCWQAVREAITQIVNAQWTWSIGTLLVPSKENNNNNPALMVQCVRHGTNKRWARDSCAQ